MPNQRGGRRGPSRAQLREQIYHRLMQERATNRALQTARGRVLAKRKRRSKKDPSFLTVRRFAIAAAGLFFIFFLGSQLGFHLPSLAAGNGSTSVSTTAAPAAPAVPDVSLAGAVPCQLNNSPRINLTTQDRVNACTSAKGYAKSQLLQKFGAGEGEAQFACLDKLWENESRWSAWAINLGSGALGIAQALGHGHVYDVGDWKAQVNWGLAYIYGSYSTPCKAWAWWQRTDPRPYGGNWY